MTNKVKQAVLRGIMIASLAAGGTSLAVAHHSAAVFDATTQKEITGTVKKFDYTNPHTWVWIDVPNEQGGVDTWGAEGMSPNYLNRRGWTRNTLKPGDKITILMHPMKDGTKAGSVVHVTLASGEQLWNADSLNAP